MSGIEDEFEDLGNAETFFVNEAIEKKATSGNSECPPVDDGLLEYLIAKYGASIVFDRNLSHEDYMYNCGIIDILKFLKQTNINQKKG